MSTFRDLGTGYYIDRQLLYIDSDKRDIDRSDSIFKYYFSLENELQNVVSLELIDYNLPQSYFPTFIGRSNHVFPLSSNAPPSSNINGNMMLDIHIVDETGTSTLDIALDLDSFNAGTLTLSGFTEPRGYIPGIIEDELKRLTTAAAHGVLNLTNYTWNVGINENGTFYIWFANNGPSTYATVTLLFASGANSDDSMHKILGFDKLDTTPGVNNGATGTYVMDSRTFKFIDVNVLNVAENTPLRRIIPYTEGRFQSSSSFSPFSADYDSSTLTSINRRPEPRFLSRPIRRLKELHIELKLHNSGRFPPFISQGHDLIFEALTLQPTQGNPSWVNQTFDY